jgi:GlpG protein
MRLVGSFETDKEGKNVSAFLKEHGIANLCEITMNRNWGSTGYGTYMSKIWVYDEDQMDSAKQLIEEYQKDPAHEKFKVTTPTTSKIEDIPSIPEGTTKTNIKITRPSVKSNLSIRSVSPITFYLIIICSWIFIWGNITAPSIESIPRNIPAMAVLSPDIDKQLYYDYPKAFEIIDKIIKIYGYEKLENPDELPPEGKFLLMQYVETPYWQGLYRQVVNKLTHHDQTIAFNAPMFEKIRQGEIWRLWSPCLLHGDIFHILFNMMWLGFLGMQIESRLRPFNFIIFLLITGVFSNTLQYLVSGSDFIGISGILCAMLTFIWVRQKQAPWEGYHLEKGMMGLIAAFILAVFAIQCISFIAEVYYQTSFSPGIANTAHLSGALIGYILGRLNIFKWSTT